MRLENAYAVLSATARRLLHAKTLVGLLVAAAVAALVIVAEQIITTWVDGQLLLAWLALWFVLFAAFALFSEAVFGWSEMLGSAFGHWSARDAQQAADAQVWQVARTDHRVMADLRAAHLRADTMQQDGGTPKPRWPSCIDLPARRAAAHWPF